MKTINSLLTELCDAGRIQYEGIHYSEGVPVYTGELWRIFPRDANGELNSHQLNRLTDLCERKDIQLRFYDETITDDNGMVHEQTPGYYGQVLTWQMIGDDCEVWSQEEAETNQSLYIDSLLQSSDNPATRWDIDLAKHGFTKFDYEAENGFHQGQTDTPESVRAKIVAEHGDEIDIIFKIDDIGQFDVHFHAWFKSRE